MLTLPDLYRKRFIPQEIVHLKDDTILLCTDSLIVTKWNTLKPRSDISHGISAYFINKNIKLSKIFNKDNQLVYWYCDIIHVITNIVNNSIIIEDLLIDVIIAEDKSVKVVDVGEVADAFEAGLITAEQVSMSLRATDFLLSIIYNGEFDEFKEIVNQYDTYTNILFKYV